MYLDEEFEAKDREGNCGIHSPLFEIKTGKGRGEKERDPISFSLITLRRKMAIHFFPTLSFYPFPFVPPLLFEHIVKYINVGNSQDISHTFMLLEANKGTTAI